MQPLGFLLFKFFTAVIITAERAFFHYQVFPTRPGVAGRGRAVRGWRRRRFPQEPRTLKWVCCIPSTHAGKWRFQNPSPQDFCCSRSRAHSGKGRRDASSPQRRGHRPLFFHPPVVVGRERVVHPYVVMRDEPVRECRRDPLRITESVFDCKTPGWGLPVSFPLFTRQCKPVFACDRAKGPEDPPPVFPMLFHDNQTGRPQGASDARSDDERLPILQGEG